jgi:hypothetical protein
VGLAVPLGSSNTVGSSVGCDTTNRILINKITSRNIFLPKKQKTGFYYKCNCYFLMILNEFFSSVKKGFWKSENFFFLNVSVIAGPDGFRAASET